MSQVPSQSGTSQTGGSRHRLLSAQGTLRTAFDENRQPTEAMYFDPSDARDKWVNSLLGEKDSQRLQVQSGKFLALQRALQRPRGAPTDYARPLVTAPRTGSSTVMRSLGTARKLVGAPNYGQGIVLNRQGENECDVETFQGSASWRPTATKISIYFKPEDEEEAYKHIPEYYPSLSYRGTLQSLTSDQQKELLTLGKVTMLETPRSGTGIEHLFVVHRIKPKGDQLYAVLSQVSDGVKGRRRC